MITLFPSWDCVEALYFSGKGKTSKKVSYLGYGTEGVILFLETGFKGRGLLRLGKVKKSRCFRKGKRRSLFKKGPLPWERQRSEKKS